MHKLLRAVYLCTALLGVSSSVDAVPVHDWSRRFGDEQSIAWKMAYDGSGNLVVVGQFDGPIDFGGGPIGTAPGDHNIFAAKFDPTGAHLWSKSIGDAGRQCAYAVAIDGLGDVYVSGAILTGTADFGGGPLGTGGFLAKFNAAGAHQWSKVFASSGESALACDGSNNVYMGGMFIGASVNFGGGALANAGAGLTDIYVAKFNAAGAHVWSKRYGDANSQFLYAIDVDGPGNVVLTGNVYGSVDFGGGALAAAGAGDASLAKLDAAGNHVWSKLFGTGATQTGFSVAIDGSGNVYHAGFYFGSLDLGGGPLPSLGSDDFYLAKFNSAGTHIWSKRFGDAGANYTCPAIAVNGAHVYLTTQFSGTIDVGGGPMTSHASALDVLLVRFDEDGTHEWSEQYGTDFSTVSPWGIAARDCNIAIGGDFHGTVDFGGGNLVNLHAADLSQAWVAQFCDDDPIPVLITRFEAVPAGAGIEVRWEVRSDEDIESFALYRGEDTRPAPITVASGPFQSNMRSFWDAKVEAGRTYTYELVLRTSAGSEFRSPVATAMVRALQATLEQNHPNPFNPSTTIAYTIDEQTQVGVGIYDAAGALVIRLDQGVQTAGRHEVTWNGVDSSGNAVGSGVYFYRLETRSGAGTRKMVLLK